jgi:DNA-binding transcriptional LysR family regulator
MELRHLRYFVAVAEELHFGRAALKLSIAQPPLSQQIQRLEKELGLLLFQRTKRRVQLTHAGQVFLREAKETLAQADHAVKAAQRAGRGELGQLVVGFVDSALYAALPPILRAFRSRFPEVELVLRELNPSEQFMALQNGRLHAGFVRSVIRDETLVQRTIFPERLIAALPNDHPLAARTQIPLGELSGEGFVIFPRALGQGFYDQIMEMCRRSGFNPRVVQEANEMQTIVSLVAAGIGVALVPWSVRNLRIKGVVYVEIADPRAQTVMLVTWRKDDPTPVLQTFLAVVSEVAEAEDKTALI